MVAMLTRNIAQFRGNIEFHAASDLLDGGNCYYYNPKSQKACFIGCQVKTGDTKLLETEYGIPEVLARILEAIFESQPSKIDKVTFALEVGDAIERDGKDLTLVSWIFLSSALRSMPKVIDTVQATIDPIIAGMNLLANGKDWSSDLAGAAGFTAENIFEFTDPVAGYASLAAAYAAYAVTDAGTAGWAAYNAIDAGGAYGEEVRLQQRNDILSLIRAA